MGIKYPDGHEEYRGQVLWSEPSNMGFGVCVGRSGYLWDRQRREAVWLHLEYGDGPRPKMSVDVTIRAEFANCVYCQGHEAVRQLQINLVRSSRRWGRPP